MCSLRSLSTRQWLASLADNIVDAHYYSNLLKIVKVDNFLTKSIRSTMTDGSKSKFSVRRP